MPTCYMKIAAVYLTSLAVSTALAQTQFSGPRNYSVGTTPAAVAVGDFNGDGIEDLAAVNSGSGNVSILLGTGDGTFLPAVNYHASNSPTFVAVGDFNGDRKPDLAVANGAQNTVSILLGNGDGTFQNPVQYSAGGVVAYIAVADFNGDGKQDLVALNNQRGTSAIGILLGNGDGTLREALITSFPTNNLLSSGSVAVADFNGDGRLDVAAAAANDNIGLPGGELIVLAGKGDGTFGPASISSLPGVVGTPYLEAGDFNGDDKTDLAVASRTGIFILLGNGDETFTPKQNPQRPLSGYGEADISLVVADLNHDGKLDLIALFYDLQTLPQAELQVVLGNGDGTFVDVVGKPCSQKGCTQLSLVPGWLSAGDFNGDSLPDLVVTNPLANSVSVFLNSYEAPVTNGAAHFVPVTPCRVADTGPMAGATFQDVVPPKSACGIPSNATAYSLNVTAVPHGPLRYLTAWPAGQPQPTRPILTSPDGRRKSTAAIVPAGTNGAFSLLVSNSTDVILDINGYFTAADSSALAFYPMTPCRIADTRNAAGPLGGPGLVRRQTRVFPIVSSPCGVPPEARAYSLNFAAVPQGPLDYLTAWPAGQPQPVVTLLAAPTGTVTANAAIVAKGQNGAISVFVADSTDLVIDINGYFAPPATGGLSLYNVSPCPVKDTRFPHPAALSGSVDVDVIASGCGAPVTARAFVFGVTAMPAGPLGYLTMWPQGEPQPMAATLNALDGAVTSNMAIVPTTNGSISLFSSDPTQLVLDLFGYFVVPAAIGTLSEANVTFGAQLVGTNSPPRTVTLTNTGELTLDIASVSITGTNAGDFAQTNTCGSSLAPRARCTITITFTPTQLGPRRAAVTINDNSPVAPQIVDLSGTGVVLVPNVTLSTAALSFGTQLVRSSGSAQSVNLSNYATSALDISISITGTDSVDFAQTNTCGSSVAPIAGCTISVTFTPTQIGARTAILLVNDSAVTLSGTGGFSAVAFNPTFINFGRLHVGQSHTAPITMTNTGNSTLDITSIAITGTSAADYSQSNNCGASVAPGASCTINATFAPIRTGLLLADVTMTDNAEGSPHKVQLKGKALRKLGSALASTRAVTAPRPTGPTAVGTLVMHLADSTREDPFLADGSKRELLVRFWYPASLKRGCQPADYTSPAVWSYLSQLAEVPLPRVETNSCWAAPITDGAHPVVVFTHGYTGTFTDYTFIFEDLASRGYVLASVDHTYEATAMEFPDGRLAKSVFGSYLVEQDTHPDEQTLLVAALSTRLSDMTFVVNQIERLNAEAGGPFTGKLDTTRLAIAGHSLGGLTTLLAMEREPRFRAGIVIDGAAPDTLPKATETPVLYLAAGRGQWDDSECHLWDQLHGRRLAVNLQGAEHLTPSDAIWLAKDAVQTGTMGVEKTIAALRSYIAAFLDASLQGKPWSALLTGPSADYPDAAVTTQQEPLCGKP